MKSMTNTEQLYIIAQIVRNKYTLDYWYGALTDLREIPELYKARGVKHKINVIERELTLYYSAIQSMFRSGQVEPWEMFQDGAHEFMREIKKMVRHYEIAIHNLILTRNNSHAMFMTRMATAKDLLNLAAYTTGIECLAAPRITPMLHISGLVAQEPSMNNDDEITVKAPASVMGRFERHCEQLNLMLLQHLGMRDGDYTINPNSELCRSLRIAGTQIQYTFTDYQLMRILMEDEGHTLEDAKEILAERRAQFEQKQKEEEEKKKKEAQKQHKKELIKQHKEQIKNQKK